MKRVFKATGSLCLAFTLLVGGIRVIGIATSPNKQYACLLLSEVIGTNHKNTLVDLISGARASVWRDISLASNVLGIVRVTGDGRHAAQWRVSNDKQQSQLYLHSGALLNPLRIQNSVPLDISPIMWSPDYRNLAYLWSTDGNRSNIAVWNVQSGHEQIMDNAKTIAYFNPGWSPDGKYLAFEKIGDQQIGTVYEIWSVEEHQLIKTFPEASILSMEWQADDHLSYVRKATDGHLWIGTTAPDGSATDYPLDNQLSQEIPASPSGVLWSPDRLYAAVETPQNNLYIFGVNGSISSAIPVVTFNVAWRDEGHVFIALQRQKPGEFQIISYTPGKPDGELKTVFTMLLNSSEDLGFELYKNTLILLWSDASNVEHSKLIDLNTDQQTAFNGDNEMKSWLGNDIFWGGEYVIARFYSGSKLVKIDWSHTDGSDPHEIQTIDGQGIDNLGIQTYDRGNSTLFLRTLPTAQVFSNNYALDLATGKTKFLFQDQEPLNYAFVTWSPDNLWYALQHNGVVYIFDSAGHEFGRDNNVEQSANSMIWVPCY